MWSSYLFTLPFKRSKCVTSFSSRKKEERERERQIMSRSSPTSVATPPPTPLPQPSRGSTAKWTKEEDSQLRAAVNAHTAKDWRVIAKQVPRRTEAQCMSRWKRVLKPGLIKGRWTAEEDAELVRLLKSHRKRHEGNDISWAAIATELGGGRLGKQCRERWT